MQYLQQNNPNSEMILMAILPRANLEPSSGVFQWPNKFTKAIESVNSGLAAFASKQAKMHYIDCAQHLVPDGKVSSSPLGAMTLASVLILLLLYTTYDVACIVSFVWHTSWLHISLPLLMAHTTHVVDASPALHSMVLLQ